MPAPILFISGTDTGVGKTTVAAGLVAALARCGRRVGVLKPAETGCEIGPDGQLIAADARRLAFFAGCNAPISTICPYRFRDPLAPSVAAERDGRRVDLKTIVAASRRLAADSDVIVVEGAGGLLVPLTATVNFADLCDQLGARLVVVVGNKLGAINHALLTIRHAEHLGLALAGYVINAVTPTPDLAAETNIGVLNQLLGTPAGIIPWLGPLDETEAERRRVGELFERLFDLDRLLA